MKISVCLFNCGDCLAPIEWRTKSVPTPYRLYYIKGGSAFFRAGDEEFELEKDAFYLFPSSLPFNIRQNPENRLNHLFFDFIMQPPVLSKRPISCKVDAHPTLAHFLKIMESTVNEYKTELTQETKDAAAKILEAFLTVFLSINKTSDMQDSDILKCIEYMEANYRENITVKDIANELFISEDYLIRKFKKQIGMTPYSYLVRLRLCIALELIKTGMTLSETAETVGFRYASSLSHALKKHRK